MFVENVPSSIDYDDIELYFQSESFSGGGETESVSQKQETFIVLFQDAEGIITADLHQSEKGFCAVIHTFTFLLFKFFCSVFLRTCNVNNEIIALFCHIAKKWLSSLLNVYSCYEQNPHNNL